MAYAYIKEFKLKSKGKWILLFMCICISFSLTGCTGSSSDRDISAGETGDTSSAQVSYEPVSNTENEDEKMNEADLSIAESMRAVMTINGKEYGMTITDTTIGHAFAKKLQDEGSYTVTGSRAADDICCSESEALETDSTENIPWVCGGVAWTGNWFTVWVSKEAAGRDMPVVAQIDEEHLEEIQALNGSMEIEVRLAAK